MTTDREYLIPVDDVGLLRIGRLVLGDEIGDHLCSCEVCSRTSKLCTASASSIAVAIGDAACRGGIPVRGVPSRGKP